MELMTKMRVAVFENQAQAETTRECLVRAGIHAELHSGSALAKLWFVPKEQSGFRIEVPAKDAQRARHFLTQWEAEHGSLKGAIHCPDCKSLRIEFPQFTEESLLTNVAMGLMAECRLVEREFYCEDCHCMWAKPQPKPQRARAHTAPNYFLEIAVQASPKASACRTKPNAAQSRLSSKVPNWRKLPTSPPTARFQVFKLWRRILGVTVLFAAMCLQLRSQHGLIAAETRAAMDEGGQNSKLAIVQPQKSSANSETPTYLRDVLPILMGKCARCHSQSPVMKNWMDYKTTWGDRWEIKRRVWDSWKGAYFKQPMPTVNSPESEAMTDEEREIIRNWVVSGAVCGVRPTFNSAQSKSERIEHGKRLFSTICAACHQPSGQGIPGRFPPLVGSDFLNSDKHRAIKVVANGLQGEVTVNGRKFNNSMPKFPLSDEEIACALTYVYNSFGNSGKDVTPQEVSTARAEQIETNESSQTQTVNIPQEKSPFE